MTRGPAEVPAAVLALLAAVLEAHPFAPPVRQAELLARELRREGWQVGAPCSCRFTTEAAGVAAPP